MAQKNLLLRSQVLLAMQKKDYSQSEQDKIINHILSTGQVDKVSAEILPMIEAMTEEEVFQTLGLTMEDRDR